MANEKLKIMQQRRKVKKKDFRRYKDINKMMKRRIRETKEEWIKKKCKAMEEL